MANQLINGINYSLDDTNHNASVIKLDSGTYTGDVIIPDSVTYNSVHYKVTSIGYEAFYNCSSLTSVTIPNSVTTIGDGSFSGCTGLKSVIIGNSVTSIGKNAFYNCSSLASVIIPNSVTSIGYEAFYNCSSLTSVTIPNSVTTIGYESFYNCSSLTSIIIPNSVTTIGDGSFSGCTGLKSITLPNSIKEINKYAFASCRSLTSVTIPNSVTTIGDGAFSGCTGLKSVIIGNSVTSIGKNVFYNCSSLTSVIIPNSVTSIGYEAFYNCSSLTSVTIPNSVTTIGDGSFSGCTGLKSVIIGNSVTSIGKNVFYNCSSLTSVTIPNSVTSIGYEAFYNCSSLTSIYCFSKNYNYILNSIENINIINKINKPNIVKLLTNRTSKMVFANKDKKVVYDNDDFYDNGLFLTTDANSLYVLGVDVNNHCIIDNYYNIYNLCQNNKLIPNFKYIITDYQSIYKCNDNTIQGHIYSNKSDTYQLVLTAISTNQFDSNISILSQPNSSKYYLTQLNKFKIKYNIDKTIFSSNLTASVGGIIANIVDGALIIDASSNINLTLSTLTSDIISLANDKNNIKINYSQTTTSPLDLFKFKVSIVNESSVIIASYSADILNSVGFGSGKIISYLYTANISVPINELTGSYTINYYIDDILKTTNTFTRNYISSYTISYVDKYNSTQTLSLQDYYKKNLQDIDLDTSVFNIKIKPGTNSGVLSMYSSKGTITYMMDYCHNTMLFDFYNSRTNVDDTVKTKINVVTNYPYQFGGDTQWNSTMDNSAKFNSNTIYGTCIVNVFKYETSANGLFYNNFIVYNTSFSISLTEDFGGIFDNTTKNISVTNWNESLICGIYNNTILKGFLTRNIVDWSYISNNNLYTDGGIDSNSLTFISSISNNSLYPGGGGIFVNILNKNVISNNTLYKSNDYIEYYKYADVVNCQLLGSGESDIQSTAHNCVLLNKSYIDHTDDVLKCVVGDLAYISYIKISPLIIYNHDGSGDTANINQGAYGIYIPDRCTYGDITIAKKGIGKKFDLLCPLVYDKFDFVTPEQPFLGHYYAECNYNYYIPYTYIKSIEDNGNRIIKIQALSEESASIKYVNKTTGVESNIIAEKPVNPFVSVVYYNVTANGFTPFIRVLNGTATYSTPSLEYKLSTDITYSVCTSDTAITTLGANTTYNLRGYVLLVDNTKVYSHELTIKTLTA